MTTKLNDRGPAVRDLQQLINQHYGTTVLTPDGIFGPLTDEVVRTLQREHNLTPDGIAGPQTLAAIRGSQNLTTSQPQNLKTSPPQNLIKRSKRLIHALVVHCSATREGQDVTVDAIRRSHMRDRGWSDIGYHYVITLDGTIHLGRDVDKIGAHVSGYNTYSIGICYVGGLDRSGKAKDTRTPAQRQSLRSLLAALHTLYPTATISGHRDFSPDLNGNGIIEPREYIKQCPCFDAKTEFADLQG